ncbi:MAG: D-alanyl-D-alanine carboxypeptidase family protein [Bacillota bacterium]|nr:D-alanyl-D-alanine carboxypeptidase family protein [Bacillota bacterium]
MTKYRCHIVAVLVTCLMLTICLVPTAFAEPEAKAGLDTTAESAVLMDPVSGRLLFEKDPDTPRSIASITKIMTMLLAVEALTDGKLSLDDIITTSDYAASMGGSQIYLEPGEEFPFREMLISIATGSANDASVAVGEHIAGSVEAFVDLMNQRAKELGCKNTHYVNPTGLPAEGHHSSARDQALILREAIKYPVFMEMSGMKEYDLRGGEFKLWNTNKLLWWYRGADSGKTGWTNEASYCLASSAERDNLRLISVVLACPQPKTHFQESMKLFNWGFARYEAVKLADKGQVIKTVAVEKGKHQEVGLITNAPVSVVVPKGENKGISFHLELPEQLTAPIESGAAVGSYIVTNEGEEILRVDLVSNRQVERLTLWQEIMRVGDEVLK